MEESGERSIQSQSMVFPNLNFLKISSEKTGSACRNGECFLFFVRKEFEVVKTTEMEIKSMMERPIPKEDWDYPFEGGEGTEKPLGNETVPKPKGGCGGSKPHVCIF